MLRGGGRLTLGQQGALVVLEILAQLAKPPHQGAAFVGLGDGDRLGEAAGPAHRHRPVQLSHLAVDDLVHLDQPALLDGVVGHQGVEVTT